MDPIWYLQGRVRLRLTSAGCAQRLEEFSRSCRLERVEFLDDLTAEFDIASLEASHLKCREGETLEQVGLWGVPAVLGFLGRWRLLTAAVVLLGVLTALVPARIWFIEVQGNGDVPQRLILEAAQECGVTFGASRRALRSEQVKNHLLWAIPELRWAGVNTDGCRAVITVSLRDEAALPEETMPGDIRASVDAVVSEVIPMTGTVLVQPGQAVRVGEILISGATDLGNATRLDRAAGEVYGLTRRMVEAVLPEETIQRQESGRVVRKYRLQIGKKYVNFLNDSGILHGTCVKMRKVDYLTLPGGFQLPVALVTEEYRLCQTEVRERTGEEDVLLEAARRNALYGAQAGSILKERLSQDGCCLEAVFECRELIGAFRPGIYTEGDTNDRENGERGAG